MANIPKKKLINADIVLCPGGYQNDFTEKHLKVALKKVGLKAWSPSSSNISSDSGQAILQCKVVLIIMSAETVQLPAFRDELSLAYISNKSIVPIGIDKMPDVEKFMDSGMKLMLAKINWTFFHKEKFYAENMPNLISAIQQELKDIDDAAKVKAGDPAAEDDSMDVYLALNNHAPDGDLSTSTAAMTDATPTTCEHLMENINCDFWERHFRGQKSVTWVELRDQFLHDYEQRIRRQLGEDKEQWLVKIMYKDIMELRKVIPHHIYLKFSGPNKKGNPDHFFERVKDYTVGICAMREVFNMKSSVRLIAIQNLGSFQTPSVITLLFDLVEDSDPNIRAIAALALVKTGKNALRIQDRLIQLLSDEDRVVRESACLSLAHMKCQKSVPMILDLWRNDAIKHVREAAELALTRIGGKEAEQAIKVTQVLSSEIDALRIAAKKKT